MNTTRWLARRSLPALLGVALLAALLAAGRAPSRVVAVADVHGAYPELVALLQRVRLIDRHLQWTGGTASLVQVGDVIDRGTRSRECLDLVMALERQAARRGGRVIPLLGNHEVMNVMGDVRYVTPAIYATFATGGSERRREQARVDYVSFLAGHRGHSHSALPPTGDSIRAGWVDSHPAGFFEYRDAFAPTGNYGRWIRSHHAVLQVGDVVFVHGGLSPALVATSVSDLDARVMGEVAAYDSIWGTLVNRRLVWRYMTLAEAVRFLGEEATWEQASGEPVDPDAAQAMQRLLNYRTWLAVSANGPLWYRGLAQAPEDSLIDGVNAMLERLKAQHIVVGHTVVSKTEVITRFDNRVFLLDTGMLTEEYGGRASALEILGGTFTAYHADGEPKVLLRAAAPSPAERPVAHAHRKL